MSSAVRTQDDPVVFEVATESSDALRARVTVHGELTCDTVSLVTSAVATHLRAGRRYLRLDITGAYTDCSDVLATVTELHDGAVGLGGMVVFDGATPDNRLGAHALELRARR